MSIYLRPPFGARPVHFRLPELVLSSQGLSTTLICFSAIMPFLRKLSLAFVLAITASCNAASAVLTPALDAQIAAVVKNEKVPGYAFAVVHLDGDLEYRWFGN
jgi:hypothetical protein